jgi:hypothetical protein
MHYAITYSMLELKSVLRYFRELVQESGIVLYPEEKINIGIDVVGKDDYSLTFRIGESFSR